MHYIINSFLVFFYFYNVQRIISYIRTTIFCPIQQIYDELFLTYIVELLDKDLIKKKNVATFILAPNFDRSS